MILGAPGKTAVLSRTVWDRPALRARDEGYKFVYDTRTGDEQLYDLAADPGEKTNLVGADPLRAAWSRQALQHWIASAARAAMSGSGAAAAADPRAVREPEGARLPPVEHEVRD